MWYLVIPPIVIVLSLSFLLWYLSRKGTDPLIVEKISEHEKLMKTPSFSRSKEFFLGVLEKLVQRFKVGSLRMHNSLSAFIQSIKASRRKVKESILLGRTAEEQSLPEQPRQSFFARLAPKHAPIKEVSQKEETVSSKESLGEEAVREHVADQVSFEEKKEFVPRPMVSETATHPEGYRKRIVTNTSREESLIARIATNPKDFTAYEELGDYYLEVENTRDAKECYRQVLKLSPVHRMVKIKIRRLEKLLTREGE